MRLAILSDTHLGHPDCSLLKKEGDTFSPTAYYQALIDAIPTDNEYLMILGDVIDFGESKYTEAYKAATCFFDRLKEDGVASKKIIYVPGNHDFNFWQAVENQKNIINPIRKGHQPRDFKWAAPCVFDDYYGTSSPNTTGANQPYTDVFLNNLTEPATEFIIAYPNAYLFTKTGETILFTHGQYFELFWAMLGEFMSNIAYDALGKTKGAALDMREVVTINSPFNTLGSSGAGQAGKLSDIIRTIQQDFSKQDISKLLTYIDRLADSITRSVPWYLCCLIKCILPLIKRELKKQAEKGYTARFNDEFMNEESVRLRVENYYQGSLLELEKISRDLQLSSPPANPTKLIFGHTHQPTSLADTSVHQEMAGTRVTLHNTGGWLLQPEKTGDENFPGANLFCYSSEEGLSSKAIRLK